MPRQSGTSPEAQFGASPVGQNIPLEQKIVPPEEEEELLEEELEVDEDPEEELDEPEEEEELEVVDEPEEDDELEVVVDEPEEEEELEEEEPEEFKQLAGNLVNVNTFLVFLPVLSVTETVNEFVLAGCESEIVNVPFCDRLL